MPRNDALSRANKAKKDEFYTCLSDIEKEMRYYKNHFNNKVIFCNCDDPFESNFFKYFVLNFNRLKLKKIIATCYTGSQIAYTQFPLLNLMGYKSDKKLNKPYKAIVNTVYDKTGDGSIDMLDVAELFKSGENQLTELSGNGDFRSDECIELMNRSDIIITNPPFSLFREYVATLMDNNKKFIIIGNINAVTYKEFFPLIMNNKVWIGPSIHSGDRVFYVPDDYPLSASGCGIDDSGKKFIRVKGVRWFTNLDIKQRHEELILVKKYNKDIYKHYDNYDAINIDRTADIPCDFSGVMGVPITFIDKYNPDQFIIEGMAAGNTKATGFYFNVPYTPHENDRGGCGVINGERVYARILIRNKHPE